MAYVIPDVSEFQVPLNASFTRGALIARVAFGTWKMDDHFLANAAMAKALWNEGKLLGGMVLYPVFLRDSTPAEQFAYVWKLIGPVVPPWLTGIMIDVEAWRGTSYAISGDHSSPLNTLYGLHAHKMGTWKGCKGYGNQGDLAELWGRRDSRCEAVVAGYSSQLTYRNVHGAVGQQYTDGDTRWAVPTIGGRTLPRASVPFGRCDHNVFPDVANGNEFRRLWGRPTHADMTSGRKPTTPSRPKPTPTTPTHPPTAPHYNVRRGSSLVASHGAYAAFLLNTGRVEIRHNGQHVAFLTEEK